MVVYTPDMIHTLPRNSLSRSFTANQHRPHLQTNASWAPTSAGPVSGHPGHHSLYPTMSTKGSLNGVSLGKTLTVAVDPKVANANARLGNPLAGISRAELINDGRRFAQRAELWQDEALIAKGALVAQDPTGFDSIPELSEEEKEVLREEMNYRWGVPRDMWWLVLCCSVAAATQGMDESVINGAQLFYPAQFGIPADSQRHTWILGLLAAAPYICSAFIGCWITYPLNKWLGRRGTLFVTSFFSLASCLWQVFPDSWEHLFVARFLLGLGIGPKSTTTPIYVAESAPPRIRGALTMSWQTFTAFGIMLGYSFNMAFLHVESKSIVGLNWRLMLGSAALPAVIVMMLIYSVPESPRWLLSKGRYKDAFDSLRRLRKHEIQAARDLYYINVLLEAEKEVLTGTSPMYELFTVPRNRRAMLASGIVMFLQQACGVNIIAYFSSNIFAQAGFSNISALASSWGFGALNWLFALPAAALIDTFGRRGLLLSTFPAMAVTLLITGMGFYIEDNHSRVAVVSLGIYLFAIAYSPGEGPVPFVYSAEAYPLYVRDLGMSFSTSLTWFFNAAVSCSFPAMTLAFTPQGAFAFYAAWNVVGFFLILLFVPETKALTLEELDQVFSVPTRKHAAYQFRQVPYWVRTYIFREKDLEKEALYEFADEGFDWYVNGQWDVRPSMVENKAIRV